MINMHCNINSKRLHTKAEVLLPWDWCPEINKHFIIKSGKLPWPKKGWELQASQFSPSSLFVFDLSFSRKTNHAGLYFEFSFLGFTVLFSAYDFRHWDEENDCWYKYDQASIEARMAEDHQRELDRVEEARRLIREYENREARIAQIAYEESPEGQAAAAAKKAEELAANKAAKKVRGEEHRRRNIEALKNDNHDSE